MPRAIRIAALFIVLAVAACSETSSSEAPTVAALEAGVDSVAERMLTALRTNTSDSLMVLMADDTGREILLGREWATEIAAAPAGR